MSAAPNLPMSEAVTWTITIDGTFTPTPEGIVVQEGDQVNFKNNSGVNISIEFQTNPPGQAVYPNMNLSINNGATGGFTAPNYDCAANYSIYEGSTEMNGPFAIQVGDGPMYVHISEPNNVVTYTPPTVAVPLGTSATGFGELEMISDVSGTSFNIGWNNNEDPFEPAIQSTDGRPHPVNSDADPGDYQYSAAPSPINNPLGGHVIVQN